MLDLSAFDFCASEASCRPSRIPQLDHPNRPPRYATIFTNHQCPYFVRGGYEATSEWNPMSRTSNSFIVCFYSFVAHPIQGCLDVTCSVFWLLTALRWKHLVHLLELTSRILRVVLRASDPCQNVIHILLASGYQSSQFLDFVDLTGTNQAS